MDYSALNDALETGCRLGLLFVLQRQIGEVVLNELIQIATQSVDIHIAGAHDSRRIAVVYQRQEKVLQGRQLVFALGRQRNRAVQRFI